MSKRFTEITKWRNSKFRSYKPLEKLAFMYILDTCDLAGFWQVDEEAMEFETKMTPIDLQGAIKGLARSIEGPRDGVIWVRNFVKHQKNLPLNPKNRAHNHIIGLIEEQGSRFPESLSLLAPPKGLASPTGKGKGRGIGNGIGRGTGSELLDAVIPVENEDDLKPF